MPKKYDLSAAAAAPTKTARGAASVILPLLLLLLLLPLTATTTTTTTAVASAQEQQQLQSSEEDDDDDDDDIVVTILSHRPLKELGDFDRITSIVGEVRNDSPNAIGGVELRGEFYDSNGQLIHLADEWDPAVSVLRPGERAPFLIPILVNDTIARSIANYTLSPDVGSSYTVNKPAALKVAIGDHGVVENTEHVAGIAYEIVGNVTNMGNRTTYVSVIATFYDAAGKIIEYKGVGTFPAEIPPGESGDFIFEEPLGAYGNWTETNLVASFNVNVESTEYLSVIEPSGSGGKSTDFLSATGGGGAAGGGVDAEQ
jgi:hypothetical protein